METNEVQVRLHRCRCYGTGSRPEERCIESIPVDSPFCPWCEDRHAETVDQEKIKVYYLNLAGEVVEG